MENVMSHDQQKLISIFLEIAVCHTKETAMQCLKATSWNLEEAINLFLIHKPNQSLSYQQQEEEQFPLPLSSKMDTLYDSFYQTSIANYCPEEIWDSKPEPSDSVSVRSSDSRLSSMYRLPQNLLFKGSFEEAKRISSRENLWLLVNLQSSTEFACHTLNRDLWSNDTVSQAVQSRFVLFQTYDRTVEGQKISSFYKIESSPPVVFLIDPITGQKMRTWSGRIEPQSFLEDLMKYIDVGPHQPIASQTSNKRIKTEKICFERNQSDDQDMSNYLDNKFERSKETCSSNNHSNRLVTPSWERKASSAKRKTMETCSSSNYIDHNEDTCLEFPDLTEEPKGECDRSIVCSFCVRFPDGRRKQRKFLKTEPIQLLWSFSYSHMETSEKKAFKLVQAIPGASKTLDYGDEKTFDQSGIANSMITVTWG